MLKCFYLLWLIAVLSGCSTSKFDESASSPYQGYSSSILFYGINDRWQHIDTQKTEEMTTNIFVPINESPDDWTEQVVVTHCPITQNIKTISDYYQQILQPELNDECYYTNPNLQIFHQSSQNLIFNYRMRECGKNPNQVAFGRIIKNSKSIDVITYSVRSDQVNDEYAQSIYQLLNNVKVIKD